MPEQIKAYCCKFRCGKIGTKKDRIAKHELMCFRNPQSKSCKTCDNLSEMECLKLGISFEITCEHIGHGQSYKLQTRCRYYDNEAVGVCGVPAPVDIPKLKNDTNPHLQFEAEMEASK